MLLDPTLGYYDEGLNLTEAALYRQARAVFGSAETLPPACYRSKVFSALEDNRIWARAWIAVGSDLEIPGAGDLLPFTIGYHGIHLQREAEGGIVGRFNKAQHGGCRSVPLQCQTGSRTRCSFTSCGHSRDREVVSSAELDEAGSVANQYLGLVPERLLPVRVEQRGSLLFACLDPRTAELSDGLEPLDGALSSEMLIGKRWHASKANWKLIGPALHSYLSTLGASCGAEPLGSDAIADHWPASHLASVLPEGSGDAAGTISLVWCLPNLLVLRTPRETLAVLLQPLSMTETQLRVLLLGDALLSDAGPAEAARLDARLEAWIATLQPALEIAEQDQVVLSAWGTPSCRQSAGDGAPQQRNVFAWLFQDYLTDRILEEDEHYGDLRQRSPKRDSQRGHDQGLDRGLSQGRL